MPLTRSAAGKPWSHDVAAECGVTIEQYPAPRACAAIGDECGLGHPYNCRRYLSEVAGMTPTLVQPSATYASEPTPARPGHPGPAPDDAPPRRPTGRAPAVTNPQEATMPITPDHERALSYHPLTAGRGELHEAVRAAAKTFAGVVDEVCPPSREAALAFTAIQEAAMWANAALAIHDPALNTTGTTPA